MYMYYVLKQECVLGSVTLPYKGPLRDQCVFVMVKFLYVMFSFYFHLVFLETLCLISFSDYMYISLKCTLSETRVGFGII